MGTYRKMIYFKVSEFVNVVYKSFTKKMFLAFLRVESDKFFAYQIKIFIAHVCRCFKILNENINPMAYF